LRLTNVVIEAVQRVYQAKTDQERAIARADERLAVAALDQHRKEHNC
jgi:hypothetical protein